MTDEVLMIGSSEKDPSMTDFDKEALGKLSDIDDDAKCYIADEVRYLKLKWSMKFTRCNTRVYYFFNFILY